jgi:hypothetical protein
MTGAAVYALVPNSSAVTGSARIAILTYSEPTTDNLMQGLNGGDYAVFSRDLGDSMKNALGEPGLINIRKQVNDKIGDYISRQVNTISQSGDNVTVIYDTRFERDGQVTMRVSFQAAEPHRISGLWFDSDKLRQ